jgi:lipopolysaccharide export system protein LptA
MTKRFFFAFLLCLVCAGTLFAVEEAKDARANQPIQIKSNELVTDSTARTATFIGKVVARQGDVTIYCDRLVISHSEKAKEVDKVEAFGNVRIVQGNRIGQSAHALYENVTGKITLDGNPKVFQGDDVVTGKIITYFVNEQKSIVTGSPDARVEAVIHPKSKDKDGSTKP